MAHTRRKFSERKLLDLEAQYPDPVAALEKEHTDRVVAAAKELCRAEGKGALSGLEEEECLEIFSRAEQRLVGEGKILPRLERIEKKNQAVAEAEVRIAVWSYRAGYMNEGHVAAALRKRNNPLPLDDCALIADFIDGKFKRTRGTTLAAARRRAQRSRLLRYAAHQVDQLQEQWRKERGGRSKRGDRNRAIDKVVEWLPTMVKEVFWEALGFDSDVPRDTRSEVVIPWFEEKMSISLDDLRPDDFKEKLHDMMKKRKAERLPLSW